MGSFLIEDVKQFFGKMEKMKFEMVVRQVMGFSLKCVLSLMNIVVDGDENEVGVKRFYGFEVVQ